MIVFANAPWKSTANKFDCCWNSQPRCEVARSLPIKFFCKSMTVHMARCFRMRPSFSLRRGNKKCASFGSTNPLMQISRVPVRANFIDVQWNHSRSVSAINQTKNSLVATSARDFCDRQDDSGWTGDVIDDDQACVCIDRLHKTIKNKLMIFKWKRKIENDRFTSKSFAAILNGLPNCVVTLIGNHDSVALLPCDAAKNCTDTSRCIRDQPDSMRLCTDVLTQHMLDFAKVLLHLSGNHFDRPCFDPRTPRINRQTDGFRDGAKGTVIEEYDPFFKPVSLADLFGASWRGYRVVEFGGHGHGNHDVK